MSQYGVHFDAVYRHNNAWGRLKDWNPPAVTMLMNDNAPWEAADAIAGVHTKLIRFYRAERDGMNGTDGPGANAEANVRRAVEMYKPFFGYYPGAYWMYFRNEISTWSNAELYAAEMVWWIKMLGDLGVKAGVGGFSVGTPDYAVLPRFEPAFKAAHDARSLFVMHEYGLGRNMQTLYDPAVGYGDHCLRYRKANALTGLFSKYPNLIKFISETGLDRDLTLNRGGGWKDWGVSEAEYLSDFNGLGWYDSELAKDGVLATIYQWGTENNWSAYDIDGAILDAVIARSKATKPNYDQGGTLPTPVPTPTPTPDPVPVLSYLVPAINANMEQPYAFGQLAVPTGWVMGYDHAKVEVHSEMEGHPTHKTEGTQSARLWGVGRWDGWYYQRVGVTPGDVYNVVVDALGTATDTVDAPSASDVTLMVGLDSAGGNDPLAVPAWAEVTNRDTWNQLSAETVATGDMMTVFVRAVNKKLRRADAFFDNLKITGRKTENTPPVADWSPKRVAYESNLRKTPEVLADLSNYVTVIGPGTLVWGGEENGGYTKVRVNGIVLGWLWTKNLRSYTLTGRGDPAF